MVWTPSWYPVSVSSWFLKLSNEVAQATCGGSLFQSPMVAKVLFSIFKYLSPLERVSIKIYKKLVESLVKPVLMYNSEIWYMDFHDILLKGALNTINHLP
jgi:hypothetical protein